MAKLQPPPDINSIRFKGWLRDVWKRIGHLTVGGSSGLLVKIDSNGDLSPSDLEEDSVLENTDVTGTSNQITVTINADGTITLSLTPTILLTGLTPSRLLSTDASKLLTSVATLTAWIEGTANQIVVTNDGDGSITLSLPQDIHTGAKPTFAGLAKVGTSSNYTTIEDDGTVKFVGDATVYDDFQSSISNIKLPTSLAPTDRFYDHGISGGVTFPVLGFAVNDYIYFDVQTHHSMKLSTVLDSHIHFSTPTDGTGNKFKFQLDVIAAPISGTWAVPSGSPFTAEKSMTSDLSDKHTIFEIADIPAVNTTVSSIYKCKLTRIAATSDEYADEVYLEFTDCHYEKDTVGSRLEGSK